MTGAGFPHSDTLGSTLGWQLPEAYRSLPRPSSAPDAQASTVCPYQLGHTTHKDTYKPRTPRPRRKPRSPRNKMLASTVQFSTTHPRTGDTSPARPQQTLGGTTDHRPRTRQRPHPAAPAALSHRDTRDGARSLRTQQRAYAPRPARDPAPRAPKGAVLGAGGEPAAELVSVPPASTTPATRAPTGTAGASRAGRGSAPAPEPGTGECSLERR
jgi:hypothetical protein